MKNYLILFSILFVALFVRFYNYENRVTFGPEQAISLNTSAQMIKEKYSLLGIENVQRFTSDGFMLFSGALFSYSLIPLLVIFNYDPLLISYYFTFLNIVTGLVLYMLTKKNFDIKTANISLFLFMFSSSMINHSMFIWILNYLPLVGILSFFGLLSLFKNKSGIYVLYLGLLSGIGFSLEYMYLFTAIFIYLIILYRYKNFIKTTLLFTLGAMIPNLPLVLFELKHSFYHLNTLLKYTLDTINGDATAGFTYYHLLHFYPVLFLFSAIFLSNVIKKKLHLLIILFILFVFSLSSGKVDFNNPTGMMEGLTINDIKNTARIIFETSPVNFNVVTLYDFDTRARTVRYYLNHVYRSYPNNVIEYKDSQAVYALAQTDYNFDNNNPWELNVFKPYNTERLSNIGEGYALFKLTK